MSEVIRFTDSYGQKRQFPRNQQALKALKPRAEKFVLPEVLEVLDRIKERSLTLPAATTAEAVGFELGIKIATVKNIFQKLQSIDLLGEKSGANYSIERRVEEGDISII